MKYFLLILSVVAVTVFSGCKSTSANIQSKDPVARVPFDVYRDGAKPTRPYKEVGKLADDGKEVEQPEIEAKMIKQAKRMGGQAIIFETPKQSGLEPGFFSWGLKFTYLYKGTVISYE